VPIVLRRAAALVGVATLAVVTGCSSSGSGNGTPTTTGVTRLTTASPERVKVVGAPHVTELRSLIADQRTRCGGHDAIEPAPAAAASCRAALARLSTGAHDFARALVFLHPPIDLEPIVADTIDAARPVIDTVRVYPAALCLGAVPPSASQRSTRCAPAGREVAEVVAAFERILDRWKTELGVGP
jgi:hypothetical protein